MFSVLAKEYNLPWQAQAPFQYDIDPFQDFENIEAYHSNFQTFSPKTGSEWGIYYEFNSAHYTNSSTLEDELDKILSPSYLDDYLCMADRFMWLIANAPSSLVHNCSSHSTQEKRKFAQHIQAQRNKILEFTDRETSSLHAFDNFKKIICENSVSMLNVLQYILRTTASIRPHYTLSDRDYIPGNQSLPSIVYDRLTPQYLYSSIARDCDRLITTHY